MPDEFPVTKDFLKEAAKGQSEMNPAQWQVTTEERQPGRYSHCSQPEERKQPSKTDQG